MFCFPFHHSANLGIFSVGSMDNFSLHNCPLSKSLSGNQPFFKHFFRSRIAGITFKHACWCKGLRVMGEN